MDFHARRFDRAAGTYASLSAVQAGMADTLMDMLPEGIAAARILEMGCGTGHLTARLRARFPAAQLLATDAAPRMLEEARRRVPGANFALLDARGPSPDPANGVGEKPFDLAASNALVQWFPDLGAHFRLVSGQLRPGGLYLVSGFLAGNFPELNDLLREEPFGYRDFPGHSREAVGSAAAESVLVLETFGATEAAGVYPDARAFLAHIQGLGSARKPPSRRPMTRGRLDLLLKRYQERYPTQGGVAATWRTWRALLRKA